MGKMKGDKSDREMRKTSKDYVEKHRLKKSTKEKDKEKKRDKDRKIVKRLNLTAEERNIVREKDRLRKRKKKREQPICVIKKSTTEITKGSVEKSAQRNRKNLRGLNKLS